MQSAMSANDGGGGCGEEDDKKKDEVTSPRANNDVNTISSIVGTEAGAAVEEGIPAAMVAASQQHDEDRVDEQEQEEALALSNNNYNNNDDAPENPTTTTDSNRSSNNSHHKEENNDDSSPSSSYSDRWRNVVLRMNRPVTAALLALSGRAAKCPKTCVALVIFVSLAMLGIGFATNFRLESSETALWTPQGSKPEAHARWIEQHGDFRNQEGSIILMVHRDGANVLVQEGVQRVFDAVQVLRTTDGYSQVCAREENVEEIHGFTPIVCPEQYQVICTLNGITNDQQQSPNNNDDEECVILGVSAFWNHNETLFQQEVSSDEDVIATFESVKDFPAQVSFDLQAMLGNAKRDENGTLVSAQSFLFFVDVPQKKHDSSLAEAFDRRATKRLLRLRESWFGETSFRLELLANKSFSAEFERGIYRDLPLVPLVFIIMTLFTCLVFFRRDWVKSRCLLGLGATACISMSVAMGFGLLFIIGVPFTNLTQLFPFIMFGIGLDDTFILFNAFERTDARKTTEERIQDTIEDVGVSIFMTTATSTCAFALGCISSIPAIRWLCVYAFPTIVIDFVYQVTFFIALLVLDEERIKNNRRDFFICCVAKREEEGEEEEEETPEQEVGNRKHLAERIMERFANWLMNPWVKALVIVVFSALLGILAYSASKLRVEFNFESVLPSDSYIIDFVESIESYSERPGPAPLVYFRFVDQSDPAIQEQMEAFVDELADHHYIKPPEMFWLHDFKNYLKSNANVQSLPFNEQVHAFLENPIYRGYLEYMALDEATGNITASSTRMFLDIDMKDIDQVLGVLNAQREISSEQPINEGRQEWAFFTFDNAYTVWEFLNVTVDELILTTILGIAIVSFMGLIFIPHWSAILFVGSMISILYVDLLGFLQFGGVTINGVSYVAFIMSIGLMVDFIMHVALRYFESTETGREAKVKDVLGTMGASILLGGLSTFLGIMPIALSDSEIVYTVYMTFLGLVTLGIAHGLILFPVILSLVGPN